MNFGFKLIGWFRVENGWKIEIIDQDIDDQPFLEDLKLTILDTLSDKPVFVINKYAWIYFTWDEKLDGQILSAITTLSFWSWGIDWISKNLSKDTYDNDEIGNEKMKKLLFILKHTIIPKGIFSEWIPLSNNSKWHLKSVLLTAVDKYSMDDLERIFYFENVKFDILERLNTLDKSEWNEIIDLFKNNLWTPWDDTWIKIFPTYLTNDNIKNVKENVLYLVENSPKLLEIIKDNPFNICFAKNNIWSLIDLLLLDNKDLKILLQQLEKIDDPDILSLLYPGYKFYKKVFERINTPNIPNKEDYLNLLVDRHKRQWEWIIFRMDKWLPKNLLWSEYKIRSNTTYDQCEYIYDNITKDPNQLIGLFRNDYDTILFLYNNITKDVNQIIELCDPVRDINFDYVKDIYESVKKCETDDTYGDFKKIITIFHHKKAYWNVAFFFKHFMVEFFNLIKNDNFHGSNWIFLLERSVLENLEFFYNKKIFTSISDFTSDKYLIHILCADIRCLNYLYDKWICTTKDGFVSIAYFMQKVSWSLLLNRFENIEYLYDKWIFTTFDDLLSKDNIGFLSVNLEHIKFLYENNICKTISDFISVWDCVWGIFEIKKFLFEKWIFTTLDDFIALGKTWLINANIKNIEFMYNKWICTTFNDFIEHEKTIWYADDKLLSIFDELYINDDENNREWVKLYWTIGDSPISNDCKKEIIHKISWFSIDKAKIYVKICEIFYNSNSSDVQAVKEFLIDDILNTDNPEKVVKKVKAIFMESDLPLISKIFQVFRYIYPEDIFSKWFENHKNSSPFLKSCKTYEKKLWVIYQDLMNIMIKSGETSLRQYIENIISCKKALNDFENWKTLDNEWYRQILSLLKKIESLDVIINGHWVKNTNVFGNIWEIDDATLREYYNKLKNSLLIKENDSIYTFFLNLCKRIWYKSLEEILDDMDKMQEDANKNWLAKYNSIQQWEIFKQWDDYFLKWINIESLWEILNRWVTSKEYLWWWEGTSDIVSSNTTPFDTDWVIVNCENVFKIAEKHWYGDLDIIINISKPWIYNSDDWLWWYDRKSYEIFKNHCNDENYRWIRTWIASTEFDAIIYRSSEIDPEKLQEIKFLIAKNGFYLPVLDLKGNVLFTPEEYHILRQSFSFSDKYKWYDIDQKDWIYVSTVQNNVIHGWNEELSKFIQEQKNLKNTDTGIDNRNMAWIVFDMVKNILESELWIKCDQSKALLWAELYDSWSTWRWTEIRSDDVDLDFTLLVNSEDYDRLDEIKKVIHEKIWTIESSDHERAEWNWFQIKSLKNNLWRDVWYENWINFELLIEKKIKSYLYPSNIAMQDRFSKIEELCGKEALDFVKQNIVIMKRLLKSQWTYKNTQWWIWWIGVENWIMQHHGNFIEALEAFENVAYEWEYVEGKESIPLEKFKNLYPIWDSWHNVVSGGNDNFVSKMTDTGYHWVLNIIKKYRTEWLEWLSKLL